MLACDSQQKYSYVGSINYGFRNLNISQER